MFHTPRFQKVNNKKHHIRGVFCFEFDILHTLAHKHAHSMKLLHTLGASVIALAVFLTTAVVAGAQSSYELPTIYVKELAFTSASVYTADNNVVSGTFLLKNKDEDDMNKLFYRIRLLGMFDEDGDPQVEYGAWVSDPISISSGEERTVPFSYTLPTVNSGSYMIEVRAMLESGQGLGWDRAAITIEGVESDVTFQSAALEVAETRFSTLVGPTIEEEQALQLVLELAGNSVGTDVTPSLVIFDRDRTGEKVYEKNLDTFTVQGPVTEYILDIPTDGFISGVYLGEITLLDTNNKQVAPLIPFRYIIGGDVVTVQTVTTSGAVVMAGNTVAVDVLYSGAPFNIVTGESRDVVDATLEVTLYGENGEIGSHEVPYDFVQSGNVVVPVEVTADVNGYRVDVTIRDSEGIVVTKYTTTVSADASYTPPVEKSPLMTYVWGGLAILALIIVLVVLRRHQNKAVGTVLLSLVVAGGIMMSGVSSAYAFTVKSCTTDNDCGSFINSHIGGGTSASTFRCAVNTGGNSTWYVGQKDSGFNSSSILSAYNSNGGQCKYELRTDQMGDYVPTVVVNSPEEGQTMEPGEEFYVEVDATFLACNNAPTGVEAAAYFAADDDAYYWEWYTYGYDASGHTSRTINKPFVFGPFTAPDAEGVYPVDIYVTNNPQHQTPIRDTSYNLVSCSTTSQCQSTTFKDNRPFFGGASDVMCGTWWQGGKNCQSTKSSLGYIGGTVMIEVVSDEETDVCSNIPGVQTSVPVGYLQIGTMCFPVPPPPGCDPGTVERTITSGPNAGQQICTPNIENTCTAYSDSGHTTQTTDFKEGNTVYFTSTATGGSGQYTYAWSINSNTTDATSQVYNTAGVYYATTTVSDNTNQPAVSDSCQITVSECFVSENTGITNPNCPGSTSCEEDGNGVGQCVTPQITNLSCSLSPTSYDVTENPKTFTWTATWLGGTAPFTADWTGAGGGETDNTSSRSATYVYTAPSNAPVNSQYNVAVEVSDASSSATYQCPTGSIGSCGGGCAQGEICYENICQPPAPDITFTVIPKVVSQGSACNLNVTADDNVTQCSVIDAISGGAVGIFPTTPQALGAYSHVFQIAPGIYEVECTNGESNFTATNNAECFQNVDIRER